MADISSIVVGGVTYAVKDETARKNKADKGNAFTVTLLAANWADNNQTITNALFKADGYAYTVTPSSVSFKAYGEAMIYAQDITTDGRCKFVCENVPTVDLTVNILRNEVSA